MKYKATVAIALRADHSQTSPREFSLKHKSWTTRPSSNARRSIGEAAAKGERDNTKGEEDEDKKNMFDRVGMRTWMRTQV